VASFNKLSAQRNQLLTAMRASMSRDEFFAGLCILACANGLGSRIFRSIRETGWTEALLNTFEISAIVLIACIVGVSLILRECSDKIRPADLVVGAGVLG
jgi:hypothetical protein